MERSESANYILLPPGEMVFEVFEIGAKVPTPKSYYRTWKFNTVYDGEIQQIWQNVMAWDEVPLLEALGYEKDEKDGIDWEIDDIVGHKRVRAEVWHEPYNGKTYAKVRNFKPAGNADSETIPF